MFSELFAFIAVVVAVVMFCSVIYLILISLYSRPGSRINCVLTELHWGENSSIHGWEGSIFFKYLSTNPIKRANARVSSCCDRAAGSATPLVLYCVAPFGVQNLLKPHYWVSQLLRMTQMRTDCCLFQWNCPFCCGILEICSDAHLNRQIWYRTLSSPACCCRLHLTARKKKHRPPEECGHFLPTAETSASDSLIIIRDGIRQRLESHCVRFIPAITRIESNFGFRSSGKMRLGQTQDAGEQPAASLLHRNMAGHQETFLSEAFSVVMPLLSPIERKMTTHNVVMDTRSRSKSIKPSWV